MTTTEERLIARIREMEQELTKRIQGAADSKKEAVEKWVNDYIMGLNVELPFSVKQILDRGGAVRSFIFKAETGLTGQYPRKPALRIQIEGAKNGYEQTRVEFPEMEDPKPGQQFRITILVEPQV